jgi:signal transduction histidine kinase
VADEGIGIGEDVLPRLFKPFFTTKSDGKGTGMGLAVAQGIAKDHGGWIDVVSQLGRGACFTVLLPKGPFDAQQRSVHR